MQFCCGRCPIRTRSAWSFWRKQRGRHRVAELRRLAPARDVVRRHREFTGRCRDRHERATPAAARLEKRDRELLWSARCEPITGPSLRPIRCPARRHVDCRREPRLRDPRVRQRASRARPDDLANRTPFTVIGVLPPGFRYMTPADVYLLLEPQVAANYRTMQNRSSHTGLYAVGRLKPRSRRDVSTRGNAEHRGRACT